MKVKVIKCDDTPEFNTHNEKFYFGKTLEVKEVGTCNELYQITDLRHSRENGVGSLLIRSYCEIIEK